ncbi:tubulin epsilon and delta complex protein 2 isoform X1 [Ctenopharyngodon idella]|uniref:tubulin epsilon and delta complex protein 2 isoform X1 n=1 Tax=Ctenopharyngodon idella TaxID=7959 RepID=UPI002232827F|nr:tubulin epsilon and delta complex protein 2 isoform X1 [Ctenopharyngodon idella]
MSLHAVEEAVKMCKAEESRLTENIRQCKEILHSMRTRVTEASELETAAAISKKDDIPPEEKQEIELLEQVLKKALKIRSTSEAHKELHSDSNQEKHPNESKHKALINYTVKEEDKRKPVKSSPPSETCKKPNHHKQAAGGNVTHGSVLVRKGPTGVTGRLTVPKSAPGKISSTGSQQKMRVKATNAKQSSPSISCQDGKFTTENVQSNAQWTPSPLLPVWRAQRAKQIRLWKKVLTKQSKPVPERTQFTERLQGTFPSEWPSRCPADIKTELDVLSQRCLDLTHCFHAEQSCAADSDSGTSHEREYESLRMLEGLERMTAELLTCADQLKKDWERWDKRSSGAFCPIRRRGEWGDPISCLPPILSYNSEAELRELESQRLRVEQLQQAVHLQKAMSDNLSSFWDSHSGTERPSAVVLRGLYSLLAEGGVQFPSLVLDSE